MRLLSFILFVTAVVQLHAQSFVNNGASIYIESNTDLSLGDSVINRGQITNNGTIYLSGSWLNEGNYSPGTGRIVLNSSGVQTINHNDQFLNSLTIAGGGDKFFEEDIFINTSVVLENGRLIALNGARIIVEQNGTITGGSDLSYVVGEVVYKDKISMMFPIGIEDAYLPVTLSDIEGTNVEIGLRAYLPQNNLQTIGTLDDVSHQQYWELKAYDSEFGGSIVELPINNESFNSDFQNVVVAESRDEFQPFHSLGQKGITGDFTSGFVTSGLKALGQIFALGIDFSITEELPPLNVYNAVSPNGDGRHDYLKIENIELYPKNEVTIYSKDGNRVFEISGYDNVKKVFDGKSNTVQLGNLPSGTYYYLIDRGEGIEIIKGFFVLTR